MANQQIEKTLSELAGYLGCNFRGDPNCVVHGIATLDKAVSGEISFFDNPRYRKYLKTTKASIVILHPNQSEECSTQVLLAENPYVSYAKVAQLFYQPPTFEPGIHPTAVVGSHCKISDSVHIGPYVVIASNVTLDDGVIIEAGCSIGQDCRIGAKSHLHARVTLYHGVRLGQRAIVHSGVVIGSDGFGFAKNQGTWLKIPQMGGVAIGNDVEIGANTTIDRGALQNTIIENDVKLDNQIQIGHNVEIGEHTAIAGCTGISGSTKIGKHCLIGGMVGIAGHLTIADNVALTGMTAVSGTLHQAGVYSSSAPLQPNKEWRKNTVRIRQLDELARRVHQLEKRLNRTTEEEVE